MIFPTSTRPAALVTLFHLLLASLALVRDAGAATQDDWRGRSIYQLFTDRFALPDGSTSKACSVTDQVYCGGTFQGIINKLDYIQGMGFTAIWISPVIKNIESQGSYGEAYHGFWSLDITQINEHFGTVDDLKALSKALHDRDMYLMIDVVANNYAAPGTPSDVVYSDFVPFNKQQYFHNPCVITDYNNDTIAQNCWLATSVVSLPDMDSQDSFVQSTWNQWGKDMVANFSLDGMRIDAAKHVDKPFWNSFQPSVDVFTIGEVYDNTSLNTCAYTSNALVSVLNYPLAFTTAGIFPNTKSSMTGIQDKLQENAQYCQDTTILGVFSENHDISRIANYTSDMAILKNMLAFVVMSDGIPIVYYGAEQAFSGGSDPYNREALWLSGYPTNSPLYTHLAALNMARSVIGKLATYTYWNSFWTYKTKVILATDDVVVLRKGYDHSIVTIVTNKGSSAAQLGPYQLGDTNFNEGDTIVEVLACTSMVVGPYGTFNVTLPAGGLPMVFVPASYLKNTTLCSSIVSAAPTNKPATSTAIVSSQLSSSFYAFSLLLAAALALI